ncbi:MAG TPA: ABC-F family ATP-binding cassette domain-containing protein [Urbifossiella sp.]|nr:ABC-F family ATP-binding cassette domain-containing protein [Urbifossiella sp.]
MSVLLAARDLMKSFSARPLFEGLTFDLRVGEKVGLIGPNGAGKSTLLRLLTGREAPDSGTVTSRRGVVVGYLAQEDAFPADQSARDVVVRELADTGLEEHERDTRAAIALTRVGFDDHDQAAGTLSGGWRKRLALARELAREPDILLLDEPTNHLDLPGVVWLEKLLRSAPFGYLVATHDRAFLRAVADDVMEVSRSYPGGVFRANGGYDSFADKRDEFLEAQARMREAVANQVRRETDWLGRKESAQRKKSRSRIGEAADRRAELAELDVRTAARGAAGIDFAGTGRQTKKLVTATGVAKALGGKPLFSGLDVLLAPGTRLGLLGPNGGGKSTLLKVLAGQLAPDAGTVARADGLRLVMFEQGRASLDPALPLRRALSPNSEMVTFRDRQLHVGGWAKQFLFQAEQLDIEVGALSGGEQARVRIAQLMLKPADVLFLDEPTNDLDIPALEVLEDSLAEFPGAVVIVSHDRELMDRLCTSVIGLDGRGNAAHYGSVTQWLGAMTREEPAMAREPAKAVAPAAKKSKKLSYKEQQEWDGMETAVTAAETVVAARQVEVEAAGTAGHTVLMAACKRLEEAQAAVEALYARWQELEARRAGE